MDKKCKTILYCALLLGVVLRCNCAGRDNKVLSPVEACGDGVLSGVNTISCIQNVSAVSTGSSTFNKPLASSSPEQALKADAVAAKQKDHLINKEVKDLNADAAL